MNAVRPRGLKSGISLARVLLSCSPHQCPYVLRATRKPCLASLGTEFRAARTLCSQASVAENRQAAADAFAASAAASKRPARTAIIAVQLSTPPRPTSGKTKSQKAQPSAPQSTANSAAPSKPSAPMWAGPGFSNAPAPDALPLPSFMGGASRADVTSQLRSICSAPSLFAAAPPTAMYNHQPMNDASDHLRKLLSVGPTISEPPIVTPAAAAQSHALRHLLGVAC